METETKNVTLHGVNFSRYGESLGRGYTLAELVAMNAADGMLYARAENSGCEGQYCEVAIWNEKARRYERLAFEKFHGGEIEVDGESLDCDECAAFAAKAINSACSSWDKWNDNDVALIHSLPSYESATAPEDLLQAGWAIIEELNRGKRTEAYVGQAGILADKMQRLTDCLTKHEAVRIDPR